MVLFSAVVKNLPQLRYSSGHLMSPQVPDLINNRTNHHHGLPPHAHRPGLGGGGGLGGTASLSSEHIHNPYGSIGLDHAFPPPPSPLSLPKSPSRGQFDSQYHNVPCSVVGLKLLFVVLFVYVVHLLADSDRDSGISPQHPMPPHGFSQVGPTTTFSVENTPQMKAVEHLRWQNDCSAINVPSLSGFGCLGWSVTFVCQLVPDTCLGQEKDFLGLVYGNEGLMVVKFAT